MDATTTHTTYCRICPAHCGIDVEVSDGRVIRIRGDDAHPLTRGFTCSKGRRLGDLHSDPDRLRESQRRRADGTFEPVPVGAAIDDVAARLSSIVDEHGPDAVGLFIGTQTYTASLTHSLASGWFRALGSRKRFTTVTIDQSAKLVAHGRLGAWAGGRQRFEDADVWLLVGTNPLVSMQGGDMTGFPVHDPHRVLADARRRGMRLVVVDPRRTEVAATADLHLQLRPGTDAALVAGLHHVILRDGLDDHDFCRRWCTGADDLRTAVEPFTPAAVSSITGVDADQIVEAARIFGGAGSGMATSGTGPDMGPWANVAEHLIQALNVICGRYPRAGDRPGGWSVLERRPSYRAQVIPPGRPWDHAPPNRFGVSWMRRELMSPVLPDEILLDGPDRIRALVVIGGNPGAAFPDQDRILAALDALDLLVVVDPYMTETARRADYVVAPSLALERAEDTAGFGHFCDEPFAQFTGPVLDRPPGVVHDWEFFLRLTQAMGLTLELGRRVYTPADAVPTDVGVLAERASGRAIDHEELRRHPRGRLFPEVPAPVVEPPADDAEGRFDVLPDDVAEELRAAMAGLTARRLEGFPFDLIVRRSKDTMNSLGRRLPGLARYGYNPCFMHPADMDDTGLDPGASVDLTSGHGTVRAFVEPDPTLRRGVVSMTHCFGGEPGSEDDPRQYGTNPARLLSISAGLQPISLMPHMTAVPVRVSPAERGRR
jgi:anaerobic selenocysteine-containing dehydrogenase